METTFQKSTDMQIIELMYNSLQPEIIMVDEEVIHLRTINQLETILETTYDQGEFFIALQEIRVIAEKIEQMEETETTKILLERVFDDIQAAGERICPYCGGSGDQSRRDPFSSPCSVCRGGGLS